MRKVKVLEMGNQPLESINALRDTLIELSTAYNDLVDELSTTPTIKEYVCETCGKVCKNALGLNGHMRSHQ